MLQAKRSELEAKHSVRKKIRMSHRCPVCAQRIKFGVEQKVLDNIDKYPFSHIVLHGNPIHVMIAYIDANMTVRGIEASQSLEISRDGDTFGQIIRNWSNPRN